MLGPATKIKEDSTRCGKEELPTLANAMLKMLIVHGPSHAHIGVLKMSLSCYVE